MVDYGSLLVSAPAKVILHGEHAVVYGKVSLATSVDLRTKLKWERLNGNKVHLDLQDLAFSASWDIEEIKNVQITPPVDIYAFKRFLGSPNVSEFAVSAAWAFVYLYQSIYGINERFVPGKFVLKSEIPVGAGLGSSAAYCTVVATAMLVTSGMLEASEIAMCDGTANRNECLTKINNWAYNAEKIIHGKPSGIDNSVSTFGGFLQFQSGTLENLKRLPELNILLINTNIPRSTKTMVTGLRSRFDEMPGVYENMFNAISEISLECRRVLENLGEQKGSTDCHEYFAKLEKLIDLNQDILRTIKVSHPVINEVCTTTLSRGLHSKLTGAGGGGCIITLLKQDIDLNELEELMKELKDLGCSCWRTKLGTNGVTVENWTM